MESNGTVWPLLMMCSLRKQCETYCTCLIGQGHSVPPVYDSSRKHAETGPQRGTHYEACSVFGGPQRAICCSYRGILSWSWIGRKGCRPFVYVRRSSPFLSRVLVVEICFLQNEWNCLLYRTPEKLHSWITIVLDAYYHNQRSSLMKSAQELMSPVTIKRLEILKQTIQDQFL